MEAIPDPAADALLQRSTNLVAAPVLLAAATDPDPDIRSASAQAMGILGEDPQVADLVQLLQKNPATAERAALEKALLAICGRSGTRCTPRLLPLTKSRDASLRLIGLRSMLASGGPEALAAANSAVTDSEESAQEEAVRVLSSWANNWPEDTGVADPLLALAKDAKKPSHRILAVRGYLEYLQGDKKLSLEQKAAKINEFLPLINRLEEKRLALSVASAVPASGTLELLVTSAADAAIAEEACLGIVNIVSVKNLQGVSGELRKRALQTVLEKSQNEGTRKKAQGLLPADPQ